MLNRYKTWGEGDAPTTEDPIKVLKHCKRLYTAVADKHTDAEGLVDFLAVAADEGYTKFHLATCETQRLKLVDMGDDLRLAFVINLHAPLLFTRRTRRPCARMPASQYLEGTSSTRHAAQRLKFGGRLVLHAK